MRRPLTLLVLAGWWSLITPVLAAAPAPAPAAWTRPGALVFTDEMPAAADGASRRLLTTSGGDPAGAPPEGIYVETASSVETRWLAITPPKAISPDILGKTLARRGAKLWGGEPFTILAIGDSVTATGPYPEILARLLGRATGNHDIRVVRAAYPGRSVDAAVRHWSNEIEPAKADLALIMFGLNDQAAGLPLDAYLEQTRWLVEKLRGQGADVVLLEPTPHINITPLPSDKNTPPPEASVFRTTGFAAALRRLGTELGAPVVPTFDAIWGAGGPDLQRAARNMWPLFPTHYSKTFTSIAEVQGKGDTIHPNAAGHLRLARAVFDTLAGRIPVAPLRVTAETCADEKGRLVTRLRLKNDSPLARGGRLAIYPFPQDDKHEQPDYALDRGGDADLTFTWPETESHEHPPCLQLVDYHGEGSRAFAVEAPLTPDTRWLRERTVVSVPRAIARLKTGNTVREVAVSWPDESEVGRIPLDENVAIAGGEITERAELAYVRHAAAASGEAVADGDLSEWADARWIPVGEPVQARWTRGQADYRAKPDDCFLHWAFKAGRNGVWIAFRATGDIAKDKFTLYFDNRPSAELGTAGPYTWIDGGLKTGGVLTLKAGDSSPAGLTGLEGRWRQTGPGSIESELFVPYAALNASAWPADGDLGASIVWMHPGADGKVTRLMWSENGHPWNTRWFGVIRRDPSGPLPWRVRVE